MAERGSSTSGRFTHGYCQGDNDQVQPITSSESDRSHRHL